METFITYCLNFFHSEALNVINIQGLANVIWGFLGFYTIMNIITGFGTFWGRYEGLDLKETVYSVIIHFTLSTFILLLFPFISLILFGIIGFCIVGLLLIVYYFFNGASRLVDESCVGLRSYINYKVKAYFKRINYFKRLQTKYEFILKNKTI